MVCTRNSNKQKLSNLKNSVYANSPCSVKKRRKYIKPCDLENSIDGKLNILRSELSGIIESSLEDVLVSKEPLSNSTILSNTVNVNDTVEEEVVTSLDKGNKNKLKNLTKSIKILNKKNYDKVVSLEVVKEVPKGMKKSGRWWKSDRKKFSSLNQTKPKTSWEKKMKLKEERKAILDAVSKIKEEKIKKWQDLRERQKQNKERRTINERKAEVVQIIKDSRKIKKMKKSQLRNVEMRDVDKMKKTYV